MGDKARANKDDAIEKTVIWEIMKEKQFLQQNVSTILFL